MAVHGHLNLFNRLEAIFGILFEATENDFLDVIGDGSIDLSGIRGRLLNLFESDGDRGISSEVGRTSEYFEKYEPQRVDVGTPVDSTFLRLLRGHVRWSAH